MEIWWSIGGDICSGPLVDISCSIGGDMVVHWWRYGGPLVEIYVVVHW